MPKRKVTQVEFAPRLGDFGRAPTAKLRVAAYARVSTEKEEQEHSLEAQTDYFETYIKENPRWEFVGLYVDDGISGLSYHNRDGFNRMVADAVNGKINLIITKSLSRFARNTVDALTTIRKLKAVNVGVFFQKEDINTLDAKGEFLLTLMSSFAEEESRSISDNITWGKRKQFADGIYNAPFGHFLGYNRGFVINEKEARVVRFIYMLALEYYAPSNIARLLTDWNIPSPGGKKVWQISTVKSILTNERYKGDALLQKTFTVDFRTKKRKINEGEVPQYYVENSHPAIIDAKAWDMVQGELRRRKAAPGRNHSQSPFSGKVICGDCGEWFGPKVWHSNSQYRRVIWQCNHKFKGEVKCTTPHLTEDALKEYTRQAVSFLIDNREALIEDGRLIRQVLSDHTEIDAELCEVETEIAVVAQMIEKTISDNAQAPLDQDEYAKSYSGLTKRYQALQKRYTALTRQREDKQFKADELSGFLFELGELDLLDTEWKDSRFRATVERITVHNDGRLVFTFTNGSEETVMM